jgi:hypothetical protein
MAKGDEGLVVRVGRFLASPLGRWTIVIYVATLLLIWSGQGAPGPIAGTAVVAWGYLAQRNRVRTPFEWHLRKPASVWGPRVMFGLGGLMIIIGASKLLSDYQDARRKEQATRQAEEDAERTAKIEHDRLTSLASTVPSKVVDWRTRLQAAAKTDAANIGTDLATAEAIKKSADALSDELGPLAPPDLKALRSEAEYTANTLFNDKGIVDGVPKSGLLLQTGQSLTAAKDWLGADEAYNDLLALLDAIDGAPERTRHMIPKDFDTARMRRQVLSLRAAIAGRVTQQRKKLEQEAEKQRQIEAYRAGCGNPPTVGPWDGELVGLERAIARNAHDPDSIDVEDCTPPVLTDDSCWASICNVRFKNMLGAKVLKQIPVTYSEGRGFAWVE